MLRFLLPSVYQKNVESEVRGDVSGYFQRIFVSLLNVNMFYQLLKTVVKIKLFLANIQAGRSEAAGDISRAKQQAQVYFGLFWDFCF